MKTIRSEFTTAGFSLAGCLILVLSILSSSRIYAQTPEGAVQTTYASAWKSPQAAPALNAFRGWAEQYAAASPAEQGQLLNLGVDLARERRDVLAAMIKTNPAVAISLSVPASLRSQLPANVVAELETRVSGVGDLEVLCAFPSMLARVPQRGIYAQAKLNGQVYDAYVYGRRFGQTSKKGIPLNGIAVGNVLALSESPVRELESGETPTANQPVTNLAQGQAAAVQAEIGGQLYSFGSRSQLQQYRSKLETAEAGLAPVPTQTAAAILQPNSTAPVPTASSAYTQGAKTVLVIRVDFSDLPGDPRSRGSNPTIYTAAYVENLGNTEVAPYYLSSSYGKATLSFTASTQLYRLPQTGASYAASANGSSQIHIDAKALAAADYNLANYDRICVLFSPMENFPNSQITYGGLAQVGGPLWWVNGEWDFRVVAHELGHTFGLFHANLWQVTSSYPADLGGTSIAYGDDFDTMGANFANSLSTDFNPWFKNMIDWIDNTNIVTVTTNGTYRVSRFDNSPGTGILSLKIPKDGTRNYWVSCKRSFTGNASMNTGAYIIWGYNVNQTSDILDMTTPGTSVADAALAIGRSFVDTNSNITITPIANGGTSPNEYIDIQINLGPNTNLVTAVVDEPSVVEGNTGTTNMVFNVNLSGPTTSPVTVGYTLTSITATVGSDVVATNGTVTFNAGETTKPVTVKVIGDTQVEFNETFQLTLTNISANAIIDNSGGIGTIIDDDLKGVVDLVVNPSTNVLQLVTALINTNSGIIVRSAQLSAQRQGTSFSAGTYQLLGNSPHTYGLTLPGIVISSGNVDDYETGPDLINGNSTFYGVPATSSQEALLDTITGGIWDHFDVTQLDIYFDVATGSNNVTFQVVFGSEEYPDFVNSPFVDGFGIFLNGTNIAFQSGLPVNINHPSFRQFAGTELNGVMAPGGQAVLTFSALVTPNSTNNHLTFIVADTSDDALDTTVYLSSLAAVPPPPVPVVNISDPLPVVEGNTMTNVTFDVTLSMVSTQQVSLAYFAANGNAKRGQDFVNTAGTLIFAPGVTNATITVPIIGDLIDEPDESFSMVIYSPTNAVIGRSQGFATIIDDDPQAAKISVTDGTVTEGDSGTTDFAFNIKLSEPSGYVVTVNYGTSPGTASVGLDYLPKAGTLAFEPGVTNITLVVKIVGDTIHEPTETFFLNLSSANYATIDDAQGQATILDNDSLPTVSVAPVSVDEGDSGTTAMAFTVTLSNPTSLPVTVDYATADGTATVADSDYTAATGQVVFEPGQLKATVIVSVNADLVEEPNETLVLNLSNPVNAGSGVMSAVGTIVNDDGPNLTIADTSVLEGAASTTTDAVFDVILRKPNGSTVTVDYEVLPGSATANVDYQPITGQLSFPSGVTSQQISVVVIGDSTLETNETFIVNLKNVVNATLNVSSATGTIIDDDTIANLGITASLPATNIYVGYPFAVTLLVTNQGPYAATNVVVDQVLPTGVTLVSSSILGTTGTVVEASGTVTTTIPVLTNGGSFSVQLLVNADSAGVKDFAATVTSNQYDDDTADNASSASKTVLTPTVSVVAAGSQLLQESNQPPNRGLDPGETVFMAFKLQNTGNIATTNVYASLRTADGVTALSGAQHYGVIAAGGVVSQQFAFTVTGAGGDLLTAVLDVYDLTPEGSNSLGSVSYTYRLSEHVNLTSASVITIPAIGPAATYPSTLTASGLLGRVSKVTVTLNGVTHGFPDDLDILLVSPTGQGVIIMSDAGGATDLNGVDLTFDDDASASLPDTTPIVAGQYKPTNYGAGDVFSGAPAGPYSTALAAFVGSVPNGDWKLYIVDDGAGDSGSITGWSLSIQTTIPADPVAELAIGGTASPNPVYVGQNFTYSISVTNMGPSTANNLRLISLLPNGVTLVTSTPAVSATDGSELTFNLGSLAMGASKLVTIEVTSTAAGTPTNYVSVASDELDLQAQNSSAAIGVRVNRVTMLAASGSVSSGGPFVVNLVGQPGLTYVIEVSTDLLTWTPVHTNTTLDGALNFTDSGAAGAGRRFYRAVER